MALSNESRPTNDEVAELVLDKLQEYGPALSVSDGESPWQVEISITMWRQPLKERE